MERRDLLKLFGVGTVLTPAASGGLLDVCARVIEPPKVEIVQELPKMDAVKALYLLVEYTNGRYRKSPIYMHQMQTYEDMTRFKGEFANLPSTLNDQAVFGSILFHSPAWPNRWKHGPNE